MDATGSEQDLRVVGSPRITSMLQARRGLVFDASEVDPQTWDEVESLLTDAFRLTQWAVVEKVPVVYVVHEPSVWGHTAPLRCAMATALLGGVRSAAVELARAGVAANAVALDETVDAEKAASTIDFLLVGSLSGQTITCGATHLGRPAA